MAIIDLASLCSPIHNFKRGFMFSYGEDPKQNKNNIVNNNSVDYNNTLHTNINTSGNTNAQYVVKNIESLSYNNGIINNSKPLVVFDSSSKDGGAELTSLNKKLLINNNGVNLGFGELNYTKGFGTITGSACGVGNGIGGYKLGVEDNNINDNSLVIETNLNEFGSIKTNIDVGYLNLGIYGSKLGCLTGFDQGYVNLSNYDNKYQIESYGESIHLNKEPDPKEEYAYNNTIKKQNSNLTQIMKNYSYFYENPIFNITNGLGNNTVIIFDLDDTLIPTDWIRDTYSRIRQNSSLNYLFTNSSNNVYQYIRMQVDQHVNHQLIPNIIKMLTISKKQFLDVAIVTNARSTGWLKVVEAMFPELIATLNELSVPIIRTSPQGTEPEIEDGEKYFNYWMMAKKNEFEKIIDKWSSANGKNNNYISHNLSNIDLISVGDNDFEECAAVHLAAIDRKVGFSKIIRCTPGLSPKMFLNQLQTISNVIEIEKKRNSPHSWINYTNTVSARIIENGQFLSGQGSYGDSTEDE
ncbi:hypothetical protein FG379_000026 [Cryptosporidium bovis]|uniref:uncharacterized protein n=1 Tax=Cryptosporidium bovis TaxID=310047 RepID=UPI00351A7FB3|nr:hypothetical protein FG379_000026 [Cryptosporidium bovis]